MGLAFLDILLFMINFLQVRCAAVYALGTFLNSCGSRSDHANSLDQVSIHHIYICCDGYMVHIKKQQLIFFYEC